MAALAVLRVDYGYFVRPAEETGTGQAQVEPVLGYAVLCSQGVLLIDTGMGQDADVDAHYRPARTSLPAALGKAGVSAGDISLVVNCHLHFDHCGGNRELPGRPVLVQRTELELAQTEDYTLPELIDGLPFDVIDGEAEPLPGVLVIPTPGHTDGHQSVVVRKGNGDVIVLAGQSHDTASSYAADLLALRAAEEQHPPPLPLPPAWMTRLRDLDPRRVLFAHDSAVWVPE